MKILVVCQHYWPEPYPLTNTCEELARRGHTVHVLTDVPNYPLGVTYEGYEKGKNRIQERNGVKIFRSFTVPRKKGPVFRVMNYYSYSLSSEQYLKNLDNDYDVVFANQSSPIMMVRAAMKYRKLHGTKVLLYCMDLWPASLSAGGISSGAVYEHYLKVSQHYYKQADRILVTSEMFKQYFNDVIGIPAEKIGWLPQFADDSFEENTETADRDGKFHLMFAGNIGSAQSVDTILKAAEIIEKEYKCDDVQFDIVGDGSELEHLKQLKQEMGIHNVEFLGRKPKDEMPKYYAMADAMMVTLVNDEFISLTLPAKVQSYMAAGKPIFAAATGEIPKVIENSGCGICVPPEDYRALAKAIMENRGVDYLKQAGRKGREYYDANFNKKIVVDRLEEELSRLAVK